MQLETVGPELARQRRQDALGEDLQAGDRRDPAQVADHQDPRTSGRAVSPGAAPSPARPGRRSATARTRRRRRSTLPSARDGRRTCRRTGSAGAARAAGRPPCGDTPARGGARPCGEDRAPRRGARSGDGSTGSARAGRSSARASAPSAASLPRRPRSCRRARRRSWLRPPQHGGAAPARSTGTGGRRAGRPGPRSDRAAAARRTDRHDLRADPLELADALLLARLGLGAEHGKGRHAMPGVEERPNERPRRERAAAVSGVRHARDHDANVHRLVSPVRRRGAL